MKKSDLIRFIQATDGLLRTGNQPPADWWTKACDAMALCRQKSLYASPEAWLAAWVLLEFLAGEDRPALPGLLTAELTAAVIMVGNPALDAMGEMYWVDGQYDSDEEWQEHDSNPEFGSMSDREVFLWGFSENASCVLPIIDCIKRLRLRWKYFSGLVEARDTIVGVSKSGEAEPGDNFWMCEFVQPTYNHLSETLPLAYYCTEELPAIAGEDDGKSPEHLMRWVLPHMLVWKEKGTAPTSQQRSHALVLALSAVLEVENDSQMQWVGPLVQVLRHWTIGPWLGATTQRAWERGAETFINLTRSLPKDLKTPAPRYPKKRDRHPHFGLSARKKHAERYGDAEGKKLHAALKGLFSTLKRGARFFGNPTKRYEDRVRYFSDVWNRSGELPKALGRALERAKEKLGRKRICYISPIIKMGDPRTATHAILLYDANIIGKKWDLRQIKTYIRYSAGDRRAVESTRIGKAVREETKAVAAS